MSDYECLNRWTPDMLMKHQMMAGDVEVRYYATKRRMPLISSIWCFFRYGRWRRYEQDFTPVFPGQPGYDEAPYASTAIWNRGMR